MTTEAKELEVLRPGNGSAMVDVASSRQAQEVQAMVIMARRFPRDTTVSLTRVLEDCKRKGLAERAVYSYPKGGQTVEGPSIRLAETLARAWGNLDFGVTELDRKAPLGNLPGESTMQAYCWDLETNTRNSKTFTVKHWRDTKRGGHAASDEREIYEIAANQGQRRLRACILAVIPTDIVDEALEQCNKTMKGGKGPLIDRVRDMVIYFKDSFSVSQDQIEKHLGHKIDTATETELVQLNKIATSLRDGYADRTDFFGDASAVESAAAQQTAEKRTIKSHVGEGAPLEKDKVVSEAAIPSPAPSQDPVPTTRPQMAIEIATLQTKLKISRDQLATYCEELFNCAPTKLTNPQMTEFILWLRAKEKQSATTN